MTSPYVPPSRTWRTRLREVATERLGLKAIALLLAVLLWLVVHARRPADDEVSAGPTPRPDGPQPAPNASPGRVVAPAPSDSTVAATP